MTQRDDVAGWALWGAAHEGDIHYTQDGRRLAALGHPGTLPLSTDCSASIVLWCNWADAPDPCGNGYDLNAGLFWTGTLRSNNPEIDIHYARVGDVIVHGAGGGHHATIIVDDAGSSNPWVVSHGQEGGPIRVRHAVEVAYHGPVWSCHRLALDAPVPPGPDPAPIPVPTPAPILEEEPMLWLVQIPRDLAVDDNEANAWQWTDLVSYRSWCHSRDESRGVISQVEARGGQIVHGGDAGPFLLAEVNMVEAKAVIAKLRDLPWVGPAPHPV